MELCEKFLYHGTADDFHWLGTLCAVTPALYQSSLAGSQNILVKNKCLKTYNSHDLMQAREGRHC